MSQREDWINAVARELGVDPDVVAAVSPSVLDMVRDVAHGVSRPSAPLTAFVLGLACAAQSKEDSRDAAATIGQVHANLERVATLVRSYAQPAQP